jgi:hypothetical protein
VAWWGLAIVVGGSALALGALHTATLCVLGLALVAILALCFWDTKPVPAARPARVAVAVGLVLVGWTFLQQLPVPAGLLATIAPANADIWDRCLTPLREAGPSWASISLDPTATRVQLLRGCVYLLAFLCALRIASRTAGVRFLERGVLIGALVVGVAAVVHPALGIERVFGVYKPQEAEFGARVAPLLNRNHLSAYLNIGSCLALGWALARRSRTPRLVPLAIYVALVGLQVWVSSRAGVAAMVAGSALVLWFVHRSDPERRAIPWKLVAPGALAVVTVAVVVLAAQERSLDELSSRDTLKLSLVRQAATTVTTFPAVGMGRGAFESVFPAFRADGEGHMVFTHPENLVLQWTAEWGIPIGLAALVALALALRPSTALARSSVPAGSAAALVVIPAHNLLDFSSEVPAVALALAICAGCVAGGASEGPAPTATSWWTRSPRLLVAVGAGVTLGAIVLAGLGIGQELGADQAALRALALDASVDKETFASAARAAMLRHPAEPYLPFMGAVRATKARDEDALPWLGRSLERASVHGRGHLLLARHLGKRYPAQARLEYRLAMEQDYNLTAAAIDEGARLVQAPEDALQLVPEGRLAPLVLGSLAQKFVTRSPAIADRLIAELSRLEPSSPVAARLAAERGLVALRQGAPPCDGDRPGCVTRTVSLARRLVEVAPATCSSYLLLAETHAEAGNAKEADAALESAIGLVDDPKPCLERLVTRAEASGDDARITAALDRLLSVGCVTDDDCAAAHLTASTVAERQGSSHGALRYAKRGHRRMPDRIDLLAAVARLSAASGLHAQALDAYRQLALREPENAEWKAAVAREEAMMPSVQKRVLGLE